MHQAQNTLFISLSYQFSQIENKSGCNIEIYAVPFSCKERSLLADLVHKQILTHSYVSLANTNAENSALPVSLSITVAVM